MGNGVEKEGGRGGGREGGREGGWTKRERWQGDREGEWERGERQMSGSSANSGGGIYVTTCISSKCKHSLTHVLCSRGFSEQCSQLMCKRFSSVLGDLSLSRKVTFITYYT